jgi:poly(A) polymerase Pap1
MARICGFPEERVESEIMTDAEVPTILRQRFTGLAIDKIADRLSFPIRDSRDVLTEVFCRHSCP